MATAAGAPARRRKANRGWPAGPRLLFGRPGDGPSAAHVQPAHCRLASGVLQPASGGVSYAPVSHLATAVRPGRRPANISLPVAAGRDYTVPANRQSERSAPLSTRCAVSIPRSETTRTRGRSERRRPCPRGRARRAGAEQQPPISTRSIWASLPTCASANQAFPALEDGLCKPCREGTALLGPRLPCPTPRPSR